MDQPTSQPVNHLPDSIRENCSNEVLLGHLEVGEKDKLGHQVLDILWCGKDYIIYLTERGVYVHFSDCGRREKQQRLAFTEICPELCELRFLTHEMRTARFPWFGKGRSNDGEGGAEGFGAPSLFDHNIAQALMLLMEEKPADAKRIAAAALEMAVKRSTNDNTIRYVGASMVAALLCCVVLGSVGYLAYYQNPTFFPLVVAGFFGVLGAAFSVAIRVRSFQAKPCQQSTMNYLMARLRILIGLVSGLMLYVIAGRSFGNIMIQPELLVGPEGAAIVGFIGGFAERLVPTVFRRTAEILEESSGTPVQLARKSTGTPSDPGREVSETLPPARTQSSLA